MLRDLLEGDEPILGGWCSIPSAFSAEVLATAGFDWICIDAQHGLIGYEAMAAMLQATAISRTPTLVRVPWNSPPDIMKALDAGATGVIVPMVNSPEEALAAAGACRYPPAGYRSWGPLRPGHGSPPDVESANRAVVCVVMIETAEGLARVDEILEVPGVDAVFVGPSDMAVTHGLKPDYTGSDPRHRKLIEDVLAACRRKGVVPGIFCGSPGAAARWQEAGFRLLAAVTDAGLIRTGAAAALRELRAGGGL